MSRRHFSPALNKRRVLTHAEYTVYSVNGLAVRNVARSDEEFGNFATAEEFPDLIPRHEVWISEKLVPREGDPWVPKPTARTGGTGWPWVRRR